MVKQTYHVSAGEYSMGLFGKEHGYVAHPINVNLCDSDSLSRTTCAATTTYDAEELI